MWLFVEFYEVPDADSAADAINKEIGGIEENEEREGVCWGNLIGFNLLFFYFYFYYVYICVLD